MELYLLTIKANKIKRLLVDLILTLRVICQVINMQDQQPQNSLYKGDLALLGGFVPLKNFLSMQLR